MMKNIRNHGKTHHSSFLCIPTCTIYNNEINWDNNSLNIPVPTALRVDDKSLLYLRVEDYDAVHFSHSIVASMQSKHISNSASETKKHASQKIDGNVIALLAFPVGSHVGQCAVDRLYNIHWHPYTVLYTCIHADLFHSDKRLGHTHSQLSPWSIHQDSLQRILIGQTPVAATIEQTKSLW